MPTCRSERLRAWPSAAAALAMLLALALPPGAAAAEGWPREITHEKGSLVLAAPPQRIVSTAPSLTGILLAIDAPVVASAAAMKGPLTDAAGFFRQWAPVAEARGVSVLYPDLDFDLEALIAQEPDLVVASATGGDSILPYLGELQAQQIPVVVLDYSSHDWQELARALGRATGHEAEAEQVSARFSAHAAEVGAGLAHPPGKVSIVSYNFAGTYAVGKPSSPQAKLVSALGFEVAGLPEALRPMVSRSSDFDFISHENLPAAITGETVFLLSGTEAAVRAFMSDPVLANLPAVRDGRVYPLGPSSFRVDYYSGQQIIDTLTPYFTR